MSKRKNKNKKRFRINKNYILIAPRGVLSVLLIGIGFGLILYGVNNRFGPFSLKATPAPSPNLEAQQQITQPVKISIPTLGRTLDVTGGHYVNNRWTVSEAGVSFLTTSALPGQTGNSVFYGHNRTKILGGLPNIKNGDSIFVNTQSGNMFEYIVFETETVKPTKVEILSQTKDKRLTIYTCEGFLDQARFVAYARLKD